MPFTQVNRSWRRGGSRYGDYIEEVATEDELRDAIRRNPEHVDTYLVYGDWLMGRSHAHGELISIQCALDRRLENEVDRAKRQELEATSKKLLKTSRPELLGGLNLYRDNVSLRWRWGFLYLVYAHFQGLKTHGEATDLMMNLGLARAAVALRELMLAPPPGGRYKRLLEAFRQNAGAAPLRGLTLGLKNERALAPVPQLDLFGERYYGEVSSFLEPFDLFPTLEEVRVNAGVIALGKGLLQAEQLRHLALRANDLSPGVVQALGAADLPALESLTLAFGSDSDVRGEHLVGLLNSPTVPRLKNLELTRVMFGDELCELLVRSSLVDQLESLKLMGLFSPAGIRLLQAERKRFAHLKSLHVIAPYEGGFFGPVTI